jgi:glutamine amidotransferase
MNFAMQNIKKNNLDVLMHKIFIKNEIRIIGICLGMQLFYEFSEEGNTPCLGIIKGKVKKFPKNYCHIGWNNVHTKLLDGIESKYKNFYFNHSFYVPYKKNNSVGVTKNIEKFSSIVSKGSFFGLQFHPEKSQLIGRKLLNELIV